MTTGEIVVGASVAIVGIIAVLLGIYWPRTDVGKSPDGDGTGSYDVGAQSDGGSGH